MEGHRIPLALRLLPRIRQRVICFHLRECANYGAWAGMQSFMVFSCICVNHQLAPYLQRAVRSGIYGNHSRC